MDVLKQKFGRKPLQYKPEELDADNISDEEYQVLNSEGGETYDAGKLEAKLEYLVNDYYSKSLKKDPAKLSLEKKQKAIKWIDHLSIQDMSIELTPEDLQNDFKRELVFYEIALENAKKALDKLKEMGMSIWRPSDFKAEMFKTDELMKRVQDNLVTAKKRIEIVDKRRDIKHKKKFADNAHKKHVQAKHMQMIETSKKKKKQRPGKARRQNYKQKK